MPTKSQHKWMEEGGNMSKVSEQTNLIYSQIVNQLVHRCTGTQDGKGYPEIQKMENIHCC